MDNRTREFMDDDQRWYTVCETHGNLCGHDTRGLAVAWMAQPSSWCNEGDNGSCRDATVQVCLHCRAELENTNATFRDPADNRVCERCFHGRDDKHADAWQVFTSDVESLPELPAPTIPDEILDAQQHLEDLGVSMTADEIAERHRQSAERRESTTSTTEALRAAWTALEAAQDDLHGLTRKAQEIAHLAQRAQERACNAAEDVQRITDRLLEGA